MYKVVPFKDEKRTRARFEIVNEENKDFKFRLFATETPALEAAKQLNAQSFNIRVKSSFLCPVVSIEKINGLLSIKIDDLSDESKAIELEIKEVKEGIFTSRGGPELFLEKTDENS